MTEPIKDLIKPATEPLVDEKVDLLDLFIGFGFKDTLNYGADSLIDTAAIRINAPINHPVVKGCAKIATAYALTKTKKTNSDIINRGKTGAEIGFAVSGMENFRDYAIYLVNKNRQKNQQPAEQPW
jgi:hypothetical protein